MSSMTSQSPENNPGPQAASAVGVGSVLSPWVAPSWARDVTEVGGTALVSFTVDACPVVPMWSGEDSAWSVVSVEQCVDLVEVDGTTYVAGAGDVRVNVEIPAGTDMGMSPAGAHTLGSALHRAAHYAVNVAGASRDQSSDPGGRALAARRVARDEPVEIGPVPRFAAPTGVPMPSWATEAREWEWDGDRWTREVLRPFRVDGGGGFDIASFQERYEDGSGATERPCVSFDLANNEISDMADMRQIGVWLIEVATILMAHEETTEATR